MANQHIVLLPLDLRPVRNSDEPLGGNFPFVLSGYGPFNPDRIRSAAILRIDIQYQTISFPVNATIRFWDEEDTSGEYVIGYGFGLRVAQRFCAPPWPNPSCPSVPATWISIDINLLDGTARTYELDPTTGDARLRLE